MSRSDLKRHAEELARDLAEVRRDGGGIDPELAAALKALIDAVTAPPDTLPAFKRSGKVKGMTATQKADRAQSIAQARAKRSKDRFLTDVAASPWRSANRYARERLGISPGMLTGYRQGTYEVPDAVNEKIAADFGYRIGKSRS